MLSVSREAFDVGLVHSFGLRLRFSENLSFGPLFLYTSEHAQAVYDILQRNFRKTVDATSVVDRLERLARLRANGELTAEEYEQAKRRLLEE